MVLNSEEEDDTPDWSEGGYEDNLTATYGSVAAAPNVGSMEKSVPEISPPAVLRLLFKQAACSSRRIARRMDYGAMEPLWPTMVGQQ